MTVIWSQLDKLYARHFKYMITHGKSLKCIVLWSYGLWVWAGWGEEGGGYLRCTHYTQKNDHSFESFLMAWCGWASNVYIYPHIWTTIHSAINRNLLAIALVTNVTRVVGHNTAGIPSTRGNNQLCIILREANIESLKVWGTSCIKTAY